MRALKPRRVLVLDLVTHAPVKALFHRVMMANMAGFMPQVAAVWTEELGHEVIYVPFVGQRDLLRDLQEHEFDVLIVSAFTQSALLATAIATWARSRGAVTVLAGPHARCFPPMPPVGSIGCSASRTRNHARPRSSPGPVVRVAPPVVP
jgi:hypothetical protein